MEAYFMGIDTGTQGVRIGISDTRGKLIFEKEQKWETEFPKVGWAEQNPLNWWEAVNGIFEQIAHTLDSEIRQNIRACCVCYLYHCYSGRSGRPPAHECHDVDGCPVKKRNAGDQRYRSSGT